MFFSLLSGAFSALVVREETPARVVKVKRLIRVHKGYSRSHFEDIHLVGLRLLGLLGFTFPFGLIGMLPSLVQLGSFTMTKLVGKGQTKLFRLI